PPVKRRPAIARRRFRFRDRSRARRRLPRRVAAGYIARDGGDVRKIGPVILLTMALQPAASWAGPTCGTQATPPATYAHVVWIWMENHSYDAIVGSSDAPYENQLIADCGLATNYHNVSHPI